MMVLLDKLPSDSVLRRHAMTERCRVLGLPPSDSVLRRHFAQLQQAVLQVATVEPPARTAAAPARPSAAAPELAAAPQAATDGGLLRWLRRMLHA
jgi:hypothetical protein